MFSFQGSNLEANHWVNKGFMKQLFCPGASQALAHHGWQNHFDNSSIAVWLPHPVLGAHVSFQNSLLWRGTVEWWRQPVDPLVLAWYMNEQIFNIIQGFKHNFVLKQPNGLKNMQAVDTRPYTSQNQDLAPSVWAQKQAEMVLLQPQGRIGE